MTGVVPYGDTVRNRDFDSNTLYFLALAQAKAGGTPTPPSTLAMAEIPPLFEQLVVSMLHKTREQRPATAKEVLGILQRVDRIGATGTGTIEVDETVIAPLSEAGAISVSSQPSVDTQFADSETLDSVPEEVREAATLEPEPSLEPITAQPEIDVITRRSPGLSKGLLWGGGATIVSLLALVGFLIFGMGTKESDRKAPSVAEKGGETPSPAHPAGLSSVADALTDAVDVLSQTDVIVRDVST